MRIGHTGDLHVTEGPRLEDAERALRYIAEDGAAQGVQLWIVGGDLAGTTVPHRHTPAERRVLCDFFQQCAETARVIVLVGNHDQALDVAVFGRLKAPHPISVVDRPTIFNVHHGLDLARVYCLPYPQKAWLLANEHVPVEDQTQVMIAALRHLLAAWRLDAAEQRAHGVLTIGTMHLNIAGAVVGGGEVMVGREPELGSFDLAELGFSIGCLSHIHRCQTAAPQWWYAGSPFCQTWGEQAETKGYLIHDVSADWTETKTTIRETPSRRFVTVEWHWTQVGGGWGYQKPPDEPDVAGAEVRVVITYPEAAPAFSVGEVLTGFTERGAASVKIDRRVIPTQRIRSQAIVSAISVADKIRAYWQSLGPTAPDAAQQERVLRLLDELEV